MPTTDVVLDLDGAKRHLNMSPDVQTDDEELQEFITSSVELVELIRREVVVARVFTETKVAARPSHAVLVDRIPILDVIELVGVDGQPWPVGSLVCDAVLGRISCPDRPLTGSVTVTYRAGRSEVPSLYRQATKVILAHLWRSQRLPLGRQQRFGSTQGDDESINLAGWSIPRAALELLGPPVPGVG